MMRLALSKGRLLEPSVAYLRQVGLQVPAEIVEERQLIGVLPDASVEVVLLKPADVPICVALGAADLGITGYDQILESGQRVLILKDFGFGRAQFVVAVPQESPIRRLEDLAGGRIATKYPNVARSRIRVPDVRWVPMQGSVEIACSLGLADAIFDLRQTGRTLQAHRLRVVAVLGETTARLIVSRHRFKIEADKVYRWLRLFQTPADEEVAVGRPTSLE
ncbi:MAG: ATP phosphoribosyltransferase [Acidobacteria bacterium]|nr:ATP phosphoribosyltransferase [Acidobacteriota bacterium]MDW7983377.1 ATP phosphoribosyltransferase [Acidobacteriota bacterium]